MDHKIISDKDQKTLAEMFNGETRRYPTGQILIFIGDVVEWLGWIRSGYVKAYKINEDGSTRIVFILTPGMVFPVFTLLALRRLPSRYFYEAMTDIETDMAPLEEAKQRMNDNKINILAELSYIGQSLLADTVDVLSAPRAEDRIRKLLSRLTHWLGGDPDNNLATLKVMLTHQDIADMAGLTRETATTVIQKLKEEQSVWYEEHRLVIDRSKILRKGGDK